MAQLKQQGERAKRKAKQIARAMQPEHQSQTEPDWLTFEKLVAQVQKSFSPGAAVTPNDKIRGHQTETLRQIDVSVRYSEGAFDVLVVMDAKDYARKIDVKHVEEFIGLVEDVAANKGVMVTTKGYTKSAKKRAEKKGIDLLVLIDSGDHRWKQLVELPAFCEITYLRTFNLIFTTEGVPLGPMSVSIGSFDLRDEPVFDMQDNPIGSVVDLLIAAWARGDIPFEEGLVENLDISKGPVKVPNGMGGLCPICIKANVHVGAERYFGHVPLAEAQGMRNEITGRSVLNKARLGAIDMNFVQLNWRKVHSAEDIAVAPAVLLEAVSTVDKSEIGWAKRAL